MSDAPPSETMVEEIGPILAEDEALKAKLSGITLSDKKNPNREVPVRFTNPSQDIADAAKLPYISIEHHSVTYDPTRDHVGPIAVGHHPSTAVLDDREHITEWPLPVRLFYHVVAYSTTHQHHAMLMRALLLPQKLPLHNGWLYIPATETWTVLHVLGYQRDSVIRQNRPIYRVTVPVHVEASLLKTEILAGLPIESIDLTVEERTDDT